MSASPPPLALVVIVAFNAGGDLQRCVDALEAQTFQDWEAIVWDNCSEDQAIDRLRTGVRIAKFKNHENIGFAAANNRAAALSNSKFIVTLNPDAFPEPQWLERLVHAAERFNVQAIASLQLSEQDPSLLDGAGDCFSIAGVAWRGGYGRSKDEAPSFPVEVFAACAAAALFRRDAFDALNGFEERFFCYHEDVDLGIRIRLRGGRCILEPSAIVHHVGSASSRNISGFAEYHGTRNRLWTFLRNMPLIYLPLAIPAHIIVVAYVVFRSPTAEVRSARIRGLRDGWRGRNQWIRERRSSPFWVKIPLLSWSPLALSGRRIVARAPQTLRQN